MKIYTRLTLLKPNFFQKLLKKSPKDNFVIELQNLLEENENNIFAIKPIDLESLRQKYSVKQNEYKESRIALLEKYRYFCFFNEEFSEENKKQALYLCELLNLDKNELRKQIDEENKKRFSSEIKDLIRINKISDSLLYEINNLQEKYEISDNEKKEIFSNIKDEIYKKKVLVIISNEKITDAERTELSKLREILNINETEGRTIYSKECQSKIQSFVNQLLQKRRMSPNEENHLYEMIKNLNVTASFNTLNLQQFRRFWEVENGSLEPIMSPINLQKNESLYYSARIDWYEERTKTTHVSYSGITLNSRIVKGLSLRSGMIFPNRHTEEYMKLIDTGDIYFTNKRIIFVGNHGNKTIPLSKVMFITPFSDGVEIGKDVGKKPFFKYSDVEIMCLYLARLLKEA